MSGILWGSNLPLRRLLASSFGALLAFVLLLYSIGFYFLVEQQFWTAGTSHLEDNVHAVLSDGSPIHERPLGVMPKRIARPVVLPADWDTKAREYVDHLSDRLHRVWVWAPDGRLLFRDTGPNQEHAFPAASAALISRGLEAWLQGGRDNTVLRASYLDTSHPEEHLQVVVIPLLEGEKLYGYLEMSVQWGPQEDALTYLLKAIVGFDLAALCLAFLVGFLLAYKLAQPLEYLHGVCLKVASGDFSARAGMGHDRNEIHQVAETLDVMVARVEQSLQEQRRFVADASHELKTPVTGMIGLAEMLKTLVVDGPPERCQRTLGLMERELERMKRLTSDLLDLSQFERKAAPCSDALQISELLREAVATLSLTFPNRRIHIQEGAAQTWLLGDSHALRRVFLNLLENALRYSSAECDVKVVCQVEGEAVCVTIRDQGCGIAPRHLPFIFERFYRVDPSRARGSGGTGLGLAIVKAIVDGHGGCIEIASTEGEGTIVKVCFPVPRETLGGAGGVGGRSQQRRALLQLAGQLFPVDSASPSQGEDHGAHK